MDESTNSTVEGSAADVTALSTELSVVETSKDEVTGKIDDSEAADITDVETASTKELVAATEADKKELSSALEKTSEADCAEAAELAATSDDKEAKEELRLASMSDETDELKLASISDEIADLTAEQSVTVTVIGLQLSI